MTDVSKEPAGIEPAGRLRDPVVTAKRLDELAKILAGALVTVAGVMTALGLSSERIFTALNNDSAPLVTISGFAIGAVLCSIIALLCFPTPRGNVLEGIALATGAVAFILALALSLTGAADAANGNGRPTIMEVKIDKAAADGKLSFKVHADGVQRDHRVSVVVDTSDVRVTAIPPVAAPTEIYRGSLRPDDKGIVDQRIEIPFTPGVHHFLNIIAANSEERRHARCDINSSKGPVCANIRLP